ncbi:hypothetical protein F511_06542 [Dorcoceras hygrometricum]|uniref:Uncharacterized protein n=1 Tax=Dorcoceras hygrometricum TaxID=472368 RepID=A0A2Z7CD04_9LAMI|nr:hypothetical protein F511_06542 [Dorcoceras hygrometricum]
MASSLFVNTLLVDFTSVVTMEHAGMVRMLKTLEDTGLRGFLEVTTPIFESAIGDFFSNARVIAGTIVRTVFGKSWWSQKKFFRERSNFRLRLIATAPQESSNLQILHTATQSLNAISTHVSYLDQSYALLCDDTNITRHHTTKLHDKVKSTAEGFDIRIDVLELTLTQRMVDKLAVVKSQLAVIVEDLKESGAAKKGEGGSSSRPREGPSGRGLTGGRGGSSSQGGRGKGRSDDPERFKYSKWF